MPISMKEFEELRQQYIKRFGDSPDTFSHRGLGEDGLVDALRKSLETGKPLLKPPKIPKGSVI